MPLAGGVDGRSHLNVERCLVSEDIDVRDAVFRAPRVLST